MQSEMFTEYEDFSGDDVLVGLSGGINSAAVLCLLASWPEAYKPRTLHLFYAHFEEHSPDTYQFVEALISFARMKFKNVVVKITYNSVLSFFADEKMIPAPALSPCTRKLKIIPMHEYMIEHSITVDFVGYVKEEIRRVRNMAKKTDNSIVGRSVTIDGIKKVFPISDKSNEWCFVIVNECIGWYPLIYTLKFNDKGLIKFMTKNLHRLSPDNRQQMINKLGKRKRVFPHNNCLPCKNMQEEDYLFVEYFYYEYYKKSIELSEQLKAHWGRILKTKTVDELNFKLDFGTAESNDGCSVCNFD